MSEKSASNALSMIGLSYLASMWLVGPLALLPAGGCLFLAALIRRPA